MAGFAATADQIQVQINENAAAQVRADKIVGCRTISNIAVLPAEARPTWARQTPDTGKA